MFTLNFKNVPHAIASFLKLIPGETVKVATVVEKVLDKAEADKGIIEGASGAIATAATGNAAIGETVITVEDAAFSVFAAVDAALKSGGDAAAQKLLDAGLDVTAINNAKAVGALTTNFVKLVKTA